MGQRNDEIDERLARVRRRLQAKHDPLRARREARPEVFQLASQIREAFGTTGYWFQFHDAEFHWLADPRDLPLNEGQAVKATELGPTREVNPWAFGIAKTTGCQKSKGRK